MRHLFIAAALLLAALIVTFGAATVLENMATLERQPRTEPYLPGAPAPSVGAPATKQPLPEQSRSLTLVTRRT